MYFPEMLNILCGSSSCETTIKYALIYGSVILRDFYLTL